MSEKEGLIGIRQNILSLVICWLDLLFVYIIKSRENLVSKIQL